MQALKHRGFTTIVGGTLYPLLVKLERNGDLASRTKPSPAGPNRKYYRLTPQGTQTLTEFSQQWTQLKGNVDQILTEALTHDEPQP